MTALDNCLRKGRVERIMSEVTYENYEHVVNNLIQSNMSITEIEDLAKHLIQAEKDKRKSKPGVY